LKLGNACYYSVQNLLSSSLLSKKLKTKIYRTIILPVVLYGCETWSLTLREERRLRVFQYRVLRKVQSVFGPKRDKVKGEWRKLHNEELSDLCSLPKLLLLLLLLSSGPKAYTSDAPQPAGLLCYPEPPLIWMFPLPSPGAPL